MSSPFSVFRRHQRLLTVILTGLAMISFVLLGAIDDPRNTPTILIVLFIAALAGGVAWMAGLNSGKASEWGISGLILGTVVGLILAFYSNESAAVQMDGGNLTQQELSQLRRERFIANQFVQQAFARTGSQGGQRNQFELTYVLPRYMPGIGFGSGEISTDEVVLGVIFRRQAEAMGIVVSDQIVMDFIKELTGDKMTRELFTNIRNQMQVSESQLMSALREELKAKQAFRLLYPDQYRMIYEPPLPSQFPANFYPMFFPDHHQVLTSSPTPLPPEAYWDFHRKLNVRQAAEVAGIPLRQFIDEQAEPSPSELQELFAQYRNNPPNMTAEGRLDEGRPGFRQPRRIQVGYLEANYDEIEPLVDEPTDEEIQKRYELQYKRSLPLDDGPMLPPQLQLPGENLPQSTPDDAPKTTPDTPKPDADAPPQSTSEKPDEAPKSEPTPDAGEKKDDAPPPAEKDDNDNSSSSVPILRTEQFVAFNQDEPPSPTNPADAPQPEKPAATTDEKPAADAEKPADKPAATTADAPEKPAQTPDKPAEKSAGDKPEEPTDDSKKPADSSVPPEPETPPTTSLEPRPLDDELKLEIRDDLLRERTQERIRELVVTAYDEMVRVSLNMQLDPGHPEYTSLDTARGQLQKFAAEKNLAYVETPFLSYPDLRESEDHQIGRAMTTLGQQGQVVADFLFFQTSPEDLYRVSQAENAFTDSGYAFWKIGDQAAFVPENLDDELVRNQVVATWRQLQAQPRAQARAQEVADLVRASEQPMSETLADVTVTGEADALLLDVRETGNFTWLTRSSAAATSLGQPPSIRPSVIPGVDDAGQRFFETVFEDLQPGDVGVAPNREGDVLYVVRIKERQPGTDEELERLRRSFLSTAAQNEFAGLTRQSLGDFSVNWVERLFEEHNVRF